MIKLAQRWKRWPLAAVLACTLLTACKKQPFSEVVEQTPYLAFPPALDQLYQVDVADLHSREDYADLKQQWENQPQSGAFFKGLRDQTGFDLLEQTDRVYIAAKGIADAKNSLRNLVFLAQGRFENIQESLKKLPGFLGSDYLVAPPPFKEEDQNGLKLYSLRAQSQYDESVFYELDICPISKDLVVVAFSKDLATALINVATGNAPGVQKDAEWLGRLRRVNTGSTIWGAGTVSKDLTGKIARAYPPAQSIEQAGEFYFNVAAVQDFKLELGLVCSSIDAATKLTGALQTLVSGVQSGFAPLEKVAPTLCALPKKISLTTELQTTKFNLTLTQAEQRALSSESEALNKRKAMMGLGGQ